MTLQELKEQIETKSLHNRFIIFQSPTNFIPNQYINAIANILALDIEYVEDLNALTNNSVDIFFGGMVETDNLRVHHTDTFDCYSASFHNRSLWNENNLIIVCKKVDKDTQVLYNDYIVEVNPLEHWCIKDYLYSILDGVDTKLIDWLMENCNYDIDRLQLEAEKLLIFNENERNIVFNQLLEDDAFSDISSKTIFDFTDAIVKKDINRLLKIYEEIENIDIEAIGVVTVLYQNFRKLLQVWMSKNPTTESTGLSSKQIYAINKLPRVWTEKQLVDILELLTSIDYRIKNGTMPVNLLRDYLVVNIVGR
jgi:hypothetical protein